MIRLDTTTRSLEVILGGAITTNQLPVLTSWADSSSGGYVGGTTPINTNSGVAVTVTAAPTSAGTVREVDFVNIYNADTVSAVVTVRTNDNGTLYILCKMTLSVGDTLRYTHAGGWTVINTSGQIKSGNGISSIGASTDNALVRWDGTGGTAIQNSGWTLADTNILTAGDNLQLGANYISYGGTDAGLSFDASNNATLSAGLTVTTTGTFSGQTVDVGAGGTGATDAALRLNGSSASNQGAFIRFQRNSVTKGFVGTESAVIGGTPDSTVLYAGAGIATKIYSNATLVATFDSATTATTLSGTITVIGTGTSTISGPLAISGASAGQIVFPATQNASSDVNTLDDYEEGTWTPTVAFGGAAVGVTYGAQTGNYVKIGRWVFISFYLSLTSNGSSTGALTITGLPFASATQASGVQGSGFYAGGLTGTSGGIVGYVSSATASINLLYSGTGTLTNLSDTTVTDTADFSGSFAYRTEG